MENKNFILLTVVIYFMNNAYNNGIKFNKLVPYVENKSNYKIIESFMIFTKCKMF